MEIWDQFLSKLEREWGKDPVNQWLRPLKVVRFDAANIYLEATDSFQLVWFQEHVKKRLQKEPLKNNNGRTVLVHLSIPLTTATHTQEPLPKNKTLLDADYTFSNFLPSKENKVALELLQTIETTPFNPVYLFGPQGSGKTHLLTAVCNYLQKKGKKAIYTKADLFTEEVIQGFRSGHMREIRATYRSASFLIIDDVHLFSRKFATQEEFFHTFNELHTSGRTIILSSRMPPSALSEIEPRLVSRFEWGITLELAKQDMESILEKKRALWNLNLHDDLIPYLIKTFSSPLTALTALSFRGKTSDLITIPLAQKILKDLIEKETHSKWTSEKILEKVAAHYAISSADILAKSQTREIALPRQVAIFLCREVLKLPYQKIGAIFDRDHSTIMASSNLIKKRIEEKDTDLIHWLRKDFEF